MEEDDSMEIDETIPATPIIERRSDEFSFPNNLHAEKEPTTEIDVEMSESTAILKTDTKDTSNKLPESTTQTVTETPVTKKCEKQDDVVILDDDDDEPLKNTGGTPFLQTILVDNL